jgi:hypothetical protein
LQARTNLLSSNKASKRFVIWAYPADSTAEIASFVHDKRQSRSNNRIDKAIF